MIDEERLAELCASGESLEREFKSDRARLSDRELYEEVVALANTNGGVLLVGVEDDGVVTGAQPRHDTTTDPLRIQATIFNNTVPSINTRISVVPHSNGSVIAIEVDRYPEPCATSQGRALRRSLKADGKPRLYRSIRVTSVRGEWIWGSWTSAPSRSMRWHSTIWIRSSSSAFGRPWDACMVTRACWPFPMNLSKALRLVETRDGTLTPNIAGIRP